MQIVTESELKRAYTTASWLKNGSAYSSYQQIARCLQHRRLWLNTIAANCCTRQSGKTEQQSAEQLGAPKWKRILNNVWATATADQKWSCSAFCTHAKYYLAYFHYITGLLFDPRRCRHVITNCFQLLQMDIVSLCLWYFLYNLSATAAGYAPIHMKNRYCAQ